MIIDVAGRDSLRKLTSADVLSECHRWLALTTALEQVSESEGDGFAQAIPRIRRRFADSWQRLSLDDTANTAMGVRCWSR